MPKHRIAFTCIKKLDRHTWYLGPRNIIFALWSDKVADEVKAEMAQCLHEQLRESTRFQAGKGALGGKEDENNITKEFLLGKPKLPRVYEDFTSGSFIEKDSLLMFEVS